jgi:hypothetical protein
MSLAGFGPEADEIMQVILKNWNTVSQRLEPVSLAGFKLQLFEILNERGQFVGQKGQESPHVTGRLDFVTNWKHEEKNHGFGTGCHWPAVTDVAKFET